MRCARHAERAATAGPAPALLRRRRRPDGTTTQTAARVRAPRGAARLRGQARRAAAYRLGRRRRARAGGEAEETDAPASAARRRGATRRPRARARAAAARGARPRRPQASARRRERMCGRARPSTASGPSASNGRSRSVEALEDEAKHWLVDDATIDAKITPELFSGPRARARVTRESRARVALRRPSVTRPPIDPPRTSSR